MVSVQIVHELGNFSLDVAFSAPPGATVLFGRSGSGKTSVIRAVAGLIRPQAGRITVADRVLFDGESGVDLPTHRRRLGYVFQEARLFPHLDVRRNLLYGRNFSARRQVGAADEFDRIVALLGLGQLVSRRPSSLSGGEMQRVAIGRALLSRPELILADEPLSALDEERRDEVLPYFERLRDEMGLPILYVSHHAAEVARIATTVVVMQGGRVVRQGPAGEVLGDPDVTPTGPRGAGAVVSAILRQHHDDGLTELIAGAHSLFVPRIAAEPGAHIRIRIAAQEVLLSDRQPVGLSALNVLPGKVAQIRHGQGPGVLVALDTPAGRILSRVTQRSSRALGIEIGASVFAVIKSVSVARGDIGIDPD